MSGYSSIEAAESLPVAQSVPVEMVEVIAPGTLSAGYTFQASYNDVVFPVTVVRHRSVKILWYAMLCAAFSHSHHDGASLCSHLEESKKDRGLSFHSQIRERQASLRHLLPLIQLHTGTSRMVCAIVVNTDRFILRSVMLSFALKF